MSDDYLIAFLVTVAVLVVVVPRIVTAWRNHRERVRLRDIEFFEQRRAAGWNDELTWSQNMVVADVKQKRLFHAACKAAAKDEAAS